MKYTDLFEHVWGADTDAERKRRIAALDPATLKAWRVLKVLGNRKGFNWWWEADDFDPEDRDEIFAEIKKAVS